MPKANEDPGAPRGSTDEPRAPSSSAEGVYASSDERHKDRQLTEELLAGFNRPSRSLHVSPALEERDFVGYYAKKSSSGSPRPMPERDVVPHQQAAARAIHDRGLPTVVHAGNRKGRPSRALWPSVGMAMLFLGSGVAFLGTSVLRSRRDAKSFAPASGPVTSLSGTPKRSSLPLEDTHAFRPTDASARLTSTAAPDASARHAPEQNREQGAASAATKSPLPLAPRQAPRAGPMPSARSKSGRDETKPIPREDFFREL